MKFDMYDLNNDGSINLEELYFMLQDTFQDLTKKEGMRDNQDTLEKILKSLTSDIMTKLDKDQSGTLDWTEFKKYLNTENYAKDTFTKLSDHMISK